LGHEHSARVSRHGHRAKRLPCVASTRHGADPIRQRNQPGSFEVGRVGLQSIEIR
jgi:hypothetical protein